jgi:hypothetical protein
MKIIEDKPIDLTFEEFCQGGKKQPEAMRLAEIIGGNCAVELRRLHSENAELLEALLYFLDDREVVDFGEWFEEGCKIAKKATAKVEGKI